jgi:hypothetical protein
MGPEIAFVLGVLVGQWVLLFAIWRAMVKLIQILASLDQNANDHSSSTGTIIEIPPVETKYPDW